MSSRKGNELIAKSSEGATRIVPGSTQVVTKDKIRKLLPKNTTIKVTDEIITLIQNMEADTGLPQELLEEDFLGYLHLLKDGKTNSLTELANAIKFCNLKRNYTNKEAWSIVFPVKYNELVAGNKVVDNFVSMFNNSKLVVAVDKEMLIPIHLQYAPYFHAAVKKQFEIMNGRPGQDAKGNNMTSSPMVMHLAAKELANLTRQPEESKISIDVNPGVEAISAQQEMNAQLSALVAMQRKRLEAGEDIIDVQELGIDFDVEVIPDA